MFAKRIKVDRTCLKNAGIMIYDKRGDLFIVQRTEPMMVSKKSITIYARKKIILKFRTSDEVVEFCNQIGVRYGTEPK